MGEAPGRADFTMATTTKVQKIMTQPINLIFRFLQNKARIQIMLYENTDMRVEGRIIGFDEYMNLVLDDAEEISRKKREPKIVRTHPLEGRQYNIDDVCW